MTIDEARQRVHEAIGGLLDDDEFAMSWVLTIDVAGSDGTRYLAHRSGGGADGTESPMLWSALGMLRADVLTCEQMLSECIEDVDDPDDE